ncbi:hypothetical protein BCR41DRAFT_396593 [Lobosporangium transversale]|uniref:Methyltransferase domain-containing protein n=1 Tax=Lobosporangium transversale TaxID=64571 RepID=A0A1Y2GLV5_9FUNG|nr:hypothetical protein BCR41DRAFT_396593 [Lobosporangium transversale]ORZ14863.1 hypothetical protein BCR41DRAFT_396593 [Lobosporangium transversale]|eukprot:XP_021880995.1 hypothetical protein BCR41DRAFT_396593 [Lobosporangium transversale]
MDFSSSTNPWNAAHSKDNHSCQSQSEPCYCHDKERAQDDGLKAFLPPGFDSLEEYLASLQSFLARCEPITNLMIVDYFTTNSWETRMPQEWRDAFESDQGRLSSLDLMELVSLGKLRDFKAAPACPKSTKSSSSSPSLVLTSLSKATTDLCSGSSKRVDQEPQDWPESLKEFVSMVKRLSINRTLDPEFTKFKNTLDIHLIPGMSPKKLHEVEILSGLIASYAKDHAIRSVIDLGAGQGYLSRVLAFQHQLCVLGVDSNTIQTCGAQTTQKRTEKLFVNKSKLKKLGGSNRKGREKVPSLSSKQSQSNQVSMPSFTTGAITSTTTALTESSSPLLSPVVETSGLAVMGVTPIDTMTTNSGPVFDKAATLADETPLLIPASSSMASSSTVSDSALPKPCKKLKTGTRSSSSPANPATGSSNGSCKKTNRSRRSRAKREETQNIPGSDTSTETAVSTSGSTDIPNISISTCDASLSSHTTNHIDKEQLKQEEGSKTAFDSASDPNLAATPGSNFQLQHITHHITAATLPTLLKEHFPKKPKCVAAQTCENNDTHLQLGHRQDCIPDDEEEEEGRWTLCGLHACGDLTSNMIKLYLESSATCLFSVGCCYHWITERFDKDGNIAISDGTHGFPLSTAFNRHSIHLGEHAKMIACQSPERWLKYQKETEDAIHGHYFRALLHKLMVERGLYPGPPAVAPVLGRMGKHRLKGFPHYLSTAINRLHLPTDVIKPEEAQAAYEEFLEQDLYRIGILWALRTMLGPLFEGMILLDRATYLYENIVERNDKNAVKKGSVQLIAGFDVVESPRNMILIALKD